MNTTLQQQKGPLPLPALEWKSIQLSELVFCLAIASTCLPFKVYPAMFLISVGFSYAESPQKKLLPWAVCLGIFSGYALISFLATYQGQPALLTGITKLMVNSIFLYFSFIWLSQRDNNNLLFLLDFTLHVIFVLFFLQLMVYHEALHFRLVAGSSSSGEASMLYDHHRFFWGLADKNMLGARIALLGFLYIMVPVIRYRRIAVWRLAFVFLLAYLSLSRTPIVALLIGCGYLLWAVLSKKYRIIMVLILVAAIPIILQKVIRVDQLTASNDGMGVRLVYWQAFFSHFSEISIWGNGFMKAPSFLNEFAQFYHGEPHIHNTFMSCYLELGIIGLVTFVLFLVFYIKACFSVSNSRDFWIACFLPLIAIMCILYSGYDNDIIMYLAILYLLGTCRDKADFGKVNIGLWNKKEKY
ncbi:O-antigen ligase domain-containing protein [Echinicola strongylocentroti]|uniref:O-antigen ligase domain-containing protein n=1 Tax=Echinicola strongylocentroti TaxID=1795355 RepID=A0A2Z4IEX7_9BACT|nr:O-antigen ligase family protein [Echinicola strongylocentroti]AWW29642.1 O-antigen ligase domain-containing protein [Echinicola strongylocentroti]